MHLDLDKIRESPVRFDQRLDLSDLVADGPSKFDVRDVRLCGQAARVERDVELEARVTATLRLQCSRCLTAFEQEMNAEIVLTLVQAMVFSPGDTAVTKADAALFHAGEGKADLRAIASEQIYLNMPLKPICRADCKGLCPACGADRNRLECGCTNQQVDARLAPLLKFNKGLGGS